MNKKTIMISQTTFLLSSEFLLVNFREEVDEGEGQHVGDQDRCHRVKEGQPFRRPALPWPRVLWFAIGAEGGIG